MPLPAAEIERRIHAALPGAQVRIVDLAGDNDHFQITVESKSFAGKTRIQQHQMVYTAIGPDMGAALHALAIKTVVGA